MQNFLLTLGYGTLALLGVAVFVAWWEHWSRTHRTAPFEDLPGHLRTGVRVDVDLATLDGASTDGQQQLQQTLNATLTEAARPSGAARGSLSWTETRPMVGPGPAVEPKAQPVAEPGNT